jgi:cyclin-dependent kinase 10
MTESPPQNRNTKLTTVKGTTIECNETPFFGSCRDVEDFQKLNRVGEGTYGVV